jgi:hypothetical protein
MLSERTYKEIDRLTGAALLKLSGQDVIERVTVIRGYVQLLAAVPERSDYETELANVLLDLSRLAIRQGKAELTLDLQLVVTAIDSARSTTGTWIASDGFPPLSNCFVLEVVCYVFPNRDERMYAASIRLGPLRITGAYAEVSNNCRSQKLHPWAIVLFRERLSRDCAILSRMSALDAVLRLLRTTTGVFFDLLTFFRSNELVFPRFRASTSPQTRAARTSNPGRLFERARSYPLYIGEKESGPVLPFHRNVWNGKTAPGFSNRASKQQENSLFRGRAAPCGAGALDHHVRRSEEPVTRRQDRTSSPGLFAGFPPASLELSSDVGDSQDVLQDRNDQACLSCGSPPVCSSEFGPGSGL